MAAPEECEWPTGEHAGPLQAVAVANVPELDVRSGIQVRMLCTRHAEELETPAPLAPPREILVPTWIVDDLLRVRWPLDSTVFPELLAARSRENTGTKAKGSPPWALTRKAFGYIATIIDARGTRGRHELDQLQATMREELSKLEVEITDPWALYHGLVWTGMITELARNGVENGVVSKDAYDAIAEIATTIAAGLVDYAPPEARP